MQIILNQGNKYYLSELMSDQMIDENSKNLPKHIEMNNMLQFYKINQL
jgi:hypothetical protein